MSVGISLQRLGGGGQYINLEVVVVVVREDRIE